MKKSRISGFAIKHSAVLTMILLALALFGLVSIWTTNLEFVPDIDMPQIFVVSVYPGASAEDVENDVIAVNCFVADVEVVMKELEEQD